MHPTINRRTVLSLAAHAGLLCTALLIAFGPLNPPGGIVTSTAKPLSEVEPRTAINLTNTPGDADSLFKITAPGSYYLTGNITGVVGKHGIEIAASGVTVDLNGFDLAGVSGMGAFDGVTVTLVGLTNIVVYNGSVRNWGDEGIDLQATAPTNARVERVTASGNAGAGIALGNGGAVHDCSVTLNLTGGVIVGAEATVAGCILNSNTGIGVSAGLGCHVHDCTSQNNTGAGIATGSGSSITACASYNNDGSGFSIGSGSTITQCAARSNAFDGIVGSSMCLILANVCSINSASGDGAGVHVSGVDNRIEGNVCTASVRGIDVDVAGNIIFRNTCSGNTTDWVIAANNVIAPIIDRRAPASAAVSGFSYAGSLGSADPNANFSY